MIRKIIIFLSIGLWMLSCQQSETDIETDKGNNSENGIPVKVGVVMGNISYQTDYTPMKSTKADSDEIKVRISKFYRIVLMKRVEDKIIIHSLMTGVTDPAIVDWGSTAYKAGESLDDIPLVLTPGKYYVTVFTGFNKLKENSNLKEGMVVAQDGISDGTQDYAYTYRVGDGGYSNVGLDYIGEEIFTGSTEFEVKKTEDLHSSSNPALDDIKITLKRCVTKFRIVLNDPPAQSYYESFASNGTEPIIKADIIATNGKFVDGLDIWGKPWYHPINERKYFKYCIEAKEDMISFPNGNKYYLSTFGSRVNAPYIFSKEGDDVEVEISNIQVLFGSNNRYYEYYGSSVHKELIHSNIDGFMLQPGTYTDESNWPPITELQLLMDNTLNIFNSYAEYNYLQNP